MSSPSDKQKEIRKKESSEGRNLVLMHVAVLFLVVYFHEWLPEPKGVDAPPEVFSSGRALSHLKSMLDTGVRTVGSPSNEIIVPQYILKQVSLIEKQKHPDVVVEAELQWPSGGFVTPFLNTFVNTYSRVTNVLVRLSPRTGDKSSNESALLLSAHYDSALGTVGASDDCLNAAANLEVLRLMARKPLRHPVIFNFNAAEETNWQAAHGFITQHRWAKTVKAMVNLESSGTGGREMVIQNGPNNAWIGRTYARAVPYPHINGVAQLIFESGVLPAQTDFQTYRDNHPTLAKLPGMDLAVVAGGYVYHTPQDDLEHVDPAHVQRLGENVYALVDALSRNPRLEDPGTLAAERDTFFDVVGLFVVRYPHTFGLFLNFLFLVAAALCIHSSPGGVTGTFSALRTVVLPAFGVSVMLPVTVGVILTVFGHHISWYTYTWLAFVLYSLPSVVGISVVYHRFAVSSPQKSSAALQHSIVAASTLLFAVFLLPMVLSGHTLTSFMFLSWFFPLFTKVVVDRFFVTPPRTASTLYFVASVPALLLWWHLYMTVIGFFLPLTARIGNQVPPNVLIAFISGPLMGLTLLIPLSKIVTFPEAELSRAARIAAFIFCVGVFAATIFLPVYSPERPKRLFMQHTHRIWHAADGSVLKEDSGLWVNPMDYEGLTRLRASWPALREAKEASCLPGTLYCDYPWYFPVSEMLGGGKWLPMPPPEVKKISLEVKENKKDGGGRVLRVKVTGPRQMALIVGQKEGDPKVVGWSFSQEVPSPRRDCQCHFVFHSAGAPKTVHDASILSSDATEARGKVGLRYNFQPFEEETEWSFDLTLASAPEGQHLDIAVYGHYLDHPLSADVHLHRETLPQWVSDLCWSSMWSAYKI